MTKKSALRLKGNILFIGGGKMCEAIIDGIIRAGVAGKENIFVSEPDRERQRYLKSKIGVTVTGNNLKHLDDATIILVAVKPGVVKEVLNEVGASITTDKLVVSIAAGVPIRFIESQLDAKCRVIRIMPNTPCLVGETAAGIALGKYARKSDEDAIVNMLSAVGKCFVVDEKLLDVITGLSGSGPAFVCMVIQALADGAVRMGLPRDIAGTLAAQTVLGTAKMVIESGMHTGQLRDSVMTPGGTTIEGVYRLEQGGLNALLMSAVEAATAKSIEMGKAFLKEE